MPRTNLSSKFLGDKISCAIVAVIFLIVWIFYLPYIRFFAIGAVIVTIMALMAFYPRTFIEFDENNMYVLNRGSETSVQLIDVTGLTSTNFRFNNRIKWKVTYRQDGIEQELGFYPGPYDNLDKFADLVRQKNPGAQIVNSRWPFS